MYDTLLYLNGLVSLKPFELQGAELLSKAPFKVWNSLLTDFVANKFVHRGIVQTLLDKIMPKYFEPNLNLASGKVICQIHSEIH